MCVFAARVKEKKRRRDDIGSASDDIGIGSSDEQNEQLKAQLLSVYNAVFHLKEAGRQVCDRCPLEPLG